MLRKDPQLPPPLTRERLRALVLGPLEELPAALAGTHPVDLAERLLDLSETEARQVFAALELEQRALVLVHAEEALRRRIVAGLSARELTELARVLPHRDGASLLALADPAVAGRALADLEPALAQELRELGAYPARSAGGTMTVEIVSVPAGARIGDAIKRIKQGAAAHEGRGVYVVDTARRPIGYLSDRALLARSIHERVEDAMSPARSVGADQDREVAAATVSHYGLREIAVVDGEGALVGTIPAGDLFDVLEEEASKDIYRLVGTSSGEQTRMPIARRVWARMPMMVITVLGGLLTARIVGWALGGGEGAALAQSVDILRFVPIVIGLAANVGVQSSTVLVRAFATGEVERDRELRVMRDEVLVGFSIGVLCGGATALATGVLGDEAAGRLFGIAIGTAILAAVTWAAFLGCGIPMVCRRIGIDPAIVAGPFLIALSDVSGTALYLGVASLLLVLA